MKLYGYGTTPNPRKVKIVLAEKGIDYEMIEVDLYKGEHRSSEFIKMNPSGKVPVLETDDGKYLTESIAICRYLEALHPEPNLFGTDAYELGLIEMRNRQIETELWSQIGTSWKNGPVVEKMGHRVVPEAKEISDANVYAYYERLNAELAETEYLVAGRFTIADVTLITGVDFAIHNCALNPAESLENLWRWHKLITSRDSVDALA
ncbi:MAG: glutathione S-transferase [Pseudomonadales bacterium]|nr:glutathione S-transferase [Pseudomonadales bacterium]